MSLTDAGRVGGDEIRSQKLFWACFISLIATAFAFMLRIMLMDTWEAEFALSQTEKGQIFGAGLWPFGVSIVLFSLFIDKIGYGKAFVFAFICHVAFALMVYFADETNGYQMLYWGSVIGALGNGTIEAAINPVIATVFRKDKTKWLNILHAGWPGGLVITGIVMLTLPEGIEWRTKILLILIPTVIYGVMMIGMRFPVSERVAAGVTHRDMLKEVGWGGALLVTFLISAELCNAFAVDPDARKWVVIGSVLLFTGIYAAYVKHFGRPMFVFLLLVMVLLATTELGTDSWIKDLLGPTMNEVFGIDSGWVLVYTAFLMMVLRLFCGPIVEALRPLGILAVSSALAAIGIYALGTVDAAILIFLAATVYGIGQTFFWPTTLGLVSERFPRGGAMTINVIAGVGMLGVGVLGNPWLGNVQDRHIADALKAEKPAIYEQYVTVPKTSVFGEYKALDAEAVKKADDATKKAINDTKDVGKRSAMRAVVILPLLMLLCYIGLMFYFRGRGGYRALDVHAGD